jgi:hypothetical protein
MKNIDLFVHNMQHVLAASRRTGLVASKYDKAVHHSLMQAFENILDEVRENGDARPESFNIAQDYVINSILAKQGINVPANVESDTHLQDDWVTESAQSAPSVAISDTAPSDQAELRILQLEGQVAELLGRESDALNRCDRLEKDMILSDSARDISDALSTKQADKHRVLERHINHFLTWLPDTYAEVGIEARRLKVLFDIYREENP